MEKEKEKFEQSHIDAALHVLFPRGLTFALDDDDLDVVEMEQHIVAWRHEQFSVCTSLTRLEPLKVQGRAMFLRRVREFSFREAVVAWQLLQGGAQFMKRSLAV